MGQRTFLNKHEIRALDRLYLENCEFLADLRRSDPVGRLLVWPRLPSALTESIAALLVPMLFGNSTQASRPSGLDDLEVFPSGKIVAVKGTGPSRWISLTDTDARAESLIWIDYSRRVSIGAKTIDVWFLSEPIAEVLPVGKVTHAQMMRWVGGKVRALRVSVDRLTRGGSEI